MWRKKRESDVAKPGFSLAYAHYLTLIFHTRCRGGGLLSGVRTSENQITPGAQLYSQYPINGRTVSSVWFGPVETEFQGRLRSTVAAGPVPPPKSYRVCLCMRAYVCVCVRACVHLPPSLSLFLSFSLSLFLSLSFSLSLPLSPSLVSYVNNNFLWKQ